LDLQELVTENLGARDATALRAMGREFRAADGLRSCRQLSKVEYPVLSAHRDQLLRWQDDQETAPMPPEGVLALAAPATRCLQGLSHPFEGVLPDGIHQIDPAAAAAFGRLRLSEHADLTDVQRVHAVAPLSLRQLRLLGVMTRTSNERLRIQDAWWGGISWSIFDPIDLQQLGRLCEACLSLQMRGGSFWLGGASFCLRMVGESLDTGGLERLLRIQPQGPRADRGLRSVHGAGPPHWRGLELSLDYCHFPDWLAEPDGGTLRLAATICPVIRTTGQWQHGPANVILMCHRIPEGAFMTPFWGDLQTRTFSNELRTVDDHAFRERHLLEVVDLEPCTSLSVIGRTAFGFCNGLTSLRLPDALVRIEVLAFAACPRLSSVKLTPMLTHLGRRAFWNCEGLEVADLSGCRSLETIGTRAFQWCAGLKVADLSGCSLLETVGTEAFQWCTALEVADLSRCHSLKAIGNGCFQGCTALHHIDLSSCGSLVSIGESAFPAHLAERILLPPGLPWSSKWFRRTPVRVRVKG